MSILLRRGIEAKQEEKEKVVLPSEEDERGT